MKEMKPSPLQIAARLKVLEETESNRALFLLEVLSNIGEADLGAVTNYLREINSGSIRLVRVKSSQELEASLRTELEDKLQKKLAGERLVFHYSVDPSFEAPLEIKAGDDLIEFSFS